MRAYSGRFGGDCVDLKEKRENLPSSPGVYLMKDSLNSVIYVGKSKNLKSRVGSYFLNNKSHSSKVVNLVNNLKDFEYITTDTEFEAFLLECKLIKEIKPIYNKLIKSPMSYAYIKVKLHEKYPSLEIASEVNKDDETFYFGPYTSRNTVERGIQGIREHCKILCNNNPRRTSGCLNYSLGLCIGMCLDSTPREQYSIIFDKILNLLNGTDKGILTEMEHAMNLASQKFDFETAAKYRDYIGAVKYLLNRVNVLEFAKENKNIALLEYLNEESLKFFLIKGNKVIFSEKYEFNANNLTELKAALKANILFYFKNKAISSQIEIGKDEIDEAQIIYSYLKNKSNNCKHAIIKKKWLETPASINIDNIINKLL
jgi:excinuclease ABC subunit C